VSEGGVPGDSPFPGLRAFEPGETHLFFGRDDQSDELLRLSARNRFVAVVGTSGSGKSSLVRAGMLPALRGGFMAEAGSSWRIGVMRPGVSPITALAESLNATAASGNGELDAATREILTETTLRRSSFGLVAAARQAWMGGDENLLVLVDQFEEIFRLRAARRQAPASEDEAAAFVSLLLEAISQTELPIYVAITMRSDFLGDCAEFPGLPEALNRSQYLIPRMTRDQQRAVIEGPVAVSGATIAPRLVQRLLNDIGDDPDQLPILQHALMRTWNAWRHEGTFNAPIDLRHYESIGGTTRALSHHADEAFGELDERGKGIARALFRRLSDTEPGGFSTRRPTSVSEISAVAEVDVAALVTVVDRFRSGDRTFLLPSENEELRPESVIDISHESLIRLWDRLRGWVEEETESAKIYRRLADAALRHKAGRAVLWRGRELRDALDWRKREKPNEAWAARYDSNFTTAIAFLEASRRRRIASGFGYAMLLALVGLSILLGFFLISEHRSKLQNFSLLLSARSLASVEAFPQRSLLLAVESIWLARETGIFYSTDAAQLLHTLLGAVGGVPLVGDASAVKAVAFSPDGRTVATGSDDGTARLWDAAHPQAARVVLRGHEGVVTGLAFSSDGCWFVTASADGTARLWDAVHPQNAPIVLSGHKGAIKALAISADSRWLATASEDHTARLWDLKAADPSVGPIVLSRHVHPVTAVAFSRSGGGSRPRAMKMACSGYGTSRHRIRETRGAR
jgi:Novel STAND NTPase 1/WD domain, G-beta repeat